MPLPLVLFKNASGVTKVLFVRRVTLSGAVIITATSCFDSNRCQVIPHSLCAVWVKSVYVLNEL